MQVCTWTFSLLFEGFLKYIFLFYYKGLLAAKSMRKVGPTF